MQTSTTDKKVLELVKDSDAWKKPRPKQTLTRLHELMERRRAAQRPGYAAEHQDPQGRAIGSC